MKKYDNYKDSGVEWIGEVPEHWEVVPLKYLSDNFDSKRVPLNSAERSEMLGDYPYYGATGIVDYINNFLFDGKYVLIGEDGAPFFIQGKDVAFIAEGKFWVNNHAHILQTNDKILSRIFCFQLNCVDYKGYITGSTRDKLTQDQLKSIKLLLPAKAEQTAIANFLDQKTTQIDHLIAKKEKFIQLLEEERVAVINQAVTKGLDPNVSMRDSGIEWLGEIPEHWEVKRIKHTTYVKGRIGWKGLRSDEFLEFSDSYVVTGTDFDNGNVKWDTCYQVPMDRYEDDPFIKLKNNDLLITKDGTIGKIAIVKDMPKIATLNSGVFLTRPQNNEYLQEYMYWILYSDVFKTFYDYNKSGSTIQHLYQNVFNEFKYTLPSLKEQTEIVKYLDKKKVEINQIKHKAQHEIELLKEYKTALISEVVTGKVDVRNEKLN